MPQNATQAPTRRDVVLIVAGEDWDGNSAPRVLQPGYSVCLRGKFGQRFDIRGPHAWMCPDCGVPLFIDRGDRVIKALQDHYWTAHGYTPALLPA